MCVTASVRVRVSGFEWQGTCAIVSVYVKRERESETERERERDVLWLQKVNTT